MMERERETIMIGHWDGSKRTLIRVPLQFIEPLFREAGTASIGLGISLAPPAYDCRVLTEDTYQYLMRVKNMLQMHLDALDLTNSDFYHKYGFNVAETFPRTRHLLTQLEKK